MQQPTVDMTTGREVPSRGSRSMAPSPANGVSPAADAHPKLLIRNLDFFYGKNQALKSITTEIYQNEITALIGPSGCGKSTFIRTLNRMNEVLPDVRTAGSVLLDGVDVYGRQMDVVELRKR